MKRMQPVTLKLVIKGTIPSKKNNKIVKVSKAGKPYTTTSAAFKKWYKKHYELVEAWLEEKKRYHPLLETPITQKIKYKVLFYFGDDRDRDLTNKLETLNDLLKDVGVIYDDSYRILSLESDGKYTKGNTRTEIYLTLKSYCHDPELLRLLEQRRQRAEVRKQKKLLVFDFADELR